MTQSNTEIRKNRMIRRPVVIGLIIASSVFATGVWAESGQSHNRMHGVQRAWAPLALLQTRPETRPESRFDYIFTQLNITAAQAESLKTLLADFMETEKANQQAMREKMTAAVPSGTREEKAAAFQAEKLVHQERLVAQLSTVLTPKQITGLQDYMSAHPVSMNNGRDHNRSGGMPFSKNR